MHNVMMELICNLEQFVAEIEERMVCLVEEMLDKPFPLLTEEKFWLFEKTGNRTVYEQDYFAKRRFLTVFGVAALRMKKDKLTKLGKINREDICKKLEAVLIDICEEECWALPAHVDRGSDVNWRKTIDLFASETAESLAYIIDMVGDWLSEACCNLVKENVKNRVLEPFFTNSVGSYHWERRENNWNAVCNGSIGSAYLHSLASDEEINEKYIDRICDNLCHFIDGYADDGTCLEGIGYYDYGMTYFVNFSMELFDISDGRIDLLRGEWNGCKAGSDDKRARIATWLSKCYFASGRTVSFSDGNSRRKYRMGLVCALAMRFPDAKLPEFRMAGSVEEDHCARFIPHKLDYFCTKEYIDYLKEHAAEKMNILSDSELEDKSETVSGMTAKNGEFVILDSAQWCIGKAVNGVGMACKGGHNAEPHNHNDVGSFLYVVGDDMLLVDLGAGEYTKAYFNEERYNIFCNNSFSHNVPIIAGNGQRAGKEYKCTFFEAVDGTDKGTVNLEFSQAYEKNLIHNIKREYVFDKINGNLEIKDVFDNVGQDIVITENLVTQYVPHVENNRITLFGESGTCHIIINPVPAFKIKTETPTGSGGRKELVYQIQWDVDVKDRTEVHLLITNNISQ